MQFKLEFFATNQHEEEIKMKASCCKGAFCSAGTGKLARANGEMKEAKYREILGAKRLQSRKVVHFLARRELN